jgi:uncharacterized coiled-coil DUF342 family protein
MAAKETTLKEVGEMLTHVVEHMATKEELNDFRAEFRAFRDYTVEELRAIRAEVADIRRELDRLKERVGHMSGYTKEIDHAFERIAAIEKHLGIGRKAAA